jgi:hypothetical protein
MADHARARRTLHRLMALAATTPLVMVALAAGAPSASADSGPVPDFGNRPLCVIDILAISCFAEGTATGGGEIVSWDWDYPGFLSNHASGQSPTLRFENTGAFDVTLTVTDDQGRTGTITEPMVVEIGA